MVWLSCSDSVELPTVPFLPVDSCLSATRNQARQKLARFTAKELMQLVCDILTDIKRRQLMLKDSKSSLPQLKHISQISDDEPLYDSVASDEDYALLSTEQQTSTDKLDQSVTASPAAVEVLTKRLLQSDSTISDLRAEVKVLQTMVEKLNSENHELRARLSQTNSVNNSINSVSGSFNLVGQTINGANGIDLDMKNQHNSLDNSDGSSDSDSKSLRRTQRPTSMYETREGIRTNNWQLLKSQGKGYDALRSSLSQSMYGDTTNNLEQSVHKYTKNVTHCIQELCYCIQSPHKQEYCVSCAEQIRIAVIELTSIIPHGAAHDNIRLLLDSTTRLLLECESLKQFIVTGEKGEQEYYKQKIRSTAYDIAKATKVLFTKFMQNTGVTNETISNK